MIVLKWLFFIAVGAVKLNTLFSHLSMCVVTVCSPLTMMGKLFFPEEYSERIKIKPETLWCLKHPTVKNRLLIKRVSEVFRDKKGEVQSIYFLGDNAPDSYDSRNFG